MLSAIQIQAITRCLLDLDHTTPFIRDDPGARLLAVLQEELVPGTRAAGTRRLRVNSVPVPAAIWTGNNDPLAALRQAYDDMRRSRVPEQLSRFTDIRFLAWLYRYTETIDDEDSCTVVRQIDAMDIDRRAYLLTRVAGETEPCVAVLPESAAAHCDGALAVLDRFARTMRTSG